MGKELMSTLWSYRFRTPAAGFVCYAIGSLQPHSSTHACDGVDYEAYSPFSGRTLWHTEASLIHTDPACKKLAHEKECI
jgi:hypothetical protein